MKQACLIVLLIVVGVAFGVQAQPTITTQPQNVLVAEGGAAEFALTATGTPPLTYLWYFNGFMMTDGGGVWGTATNTLVIDTVTLSNVGNYSCQVDDLNGTVYSNTVTLNVGEPPLAQFGNSPPAALNTNATTDSGWDELPQITTDGAGNWVAIWASDEPDIGAGIGADYDILVSRSTDNGLTWTPPAALNTNAATDSGGDVEPQVTTDGAGNWVAVWASYEPDIGAGIGGDGDILVSRSTDNGATWTAPAALNTNAATDSGNDWESEVTTDGAGNWVAVWDSEESNIGAGIGTDYDILISRSTDNGATWTVPAALNSNADSDTRDDRYAKVTTNGAGNWVSVWESEEANIGAGIGTDWDILVSRSTNNGATWTAPVALNINAATDSGGDRRAQVTTDGMGDWVAVWGSTEANIGSGIGTDYDFLVSRSTDNGATWTAPAALNTNAATDSGGDWCPQVTTDGAGNWVAVWYSYEPDIGSGIGTDGDILVSRSTDNGTIWTAPAAFNTNAATDSGRDWFPQAATDGAGNWVVAWMSEEPNIGAGIGTDYDILVSVMPPPSGFSPPMALNTNAGSDSEHDTYPRVTTDGAGNWVAVWRSSEPNIGPGIGSDLDILVSRSTNNSATWTAPAALNTNAATDSGDDLYCPVTTDGAGNWVAVWGS
ncbi:MAG: hypothetical protein GY851_18915, partial [bacterium]|nr:hypothetical protein [bacterium]